MQVREQAEFQAGAGAQPATRPVQMASIQRIDRAIRDAFIYLEALDRRTLSALTPRLTVAQYHALAALALVPTQSLGELAERLLCDKANATGLMDKLTAAGLADRTRDPRDGRRVVLRLTSAGREVLDRARQARMEALASAFQPLGNTHEMEEQVRRLVDLLKTVVDGYADGECTSEQ